MFLDKTELLIKLDSREVSGIHEGGDRDTSVSLHDRFKQAAAPALSAIAGGDSQIADLDAFSCRPGHKNPDRPLWTASCEDQPMHERNRLVPAL